MEMDLKKKLYSNKDETDELRYMNITRVIPYAGDRSFLYVLESKEPLPDVSEYSETDWNRDYKKLQEIVGDRRAKKIFDMALMEFRFDFSSTHPFIGNLWSVLGFVSNYSNFMSGDYIPDHERAACHIKTYRCKQSHRFIRHHLKQFPLRAH